MMGTKSVCSADEWKVIESRELSRTRLVKDGIVNENEAEKLARGTSGDLKARAKALRPSSGLKSPLWQLVRNNSSIRLADADSPIRPSPVFWQSFRPGRLSVRENANDSSFWL
jgi:hypothetical protein